jgi:hypothetical protein
MIAVRTTMNILSIILMFTFLLGILLFIILSFSLIVFPENTPLILIRIVSTFACIDSMVLFVLVLRFIAYKIQG